MRLTFLCCFLEKMYVITPLFWASLIHPPWFHQLIHFTPRNTNQFSKILFMIFQFRICVTLIFNPEYPEFPKTILTLLSGSCIFFDRRSFIWSWPKNILTFSQKNNTAKIIHFVYEIYFLDSFTAGFSDWIVIVLNCYSWNIRFSFQWASIK